VCQKNDRFWERGKGVSLKRYIGHGKEMGKRGLRSGCPRSARQKKNSRKKSARPAARTKKAFGNSPPAGNLSSFKSPDNDLSMTVGGGGDFHSMGLETFARRSISREKKNNNERRKIDDLIERKRGQSHE